MPERDRLETSYRRLLWAYPRFYRRLRGLEILTTMLDAAQPGQRRPTRDEVIHLLLSGLKCRLAPPGWAGKIAASVVTLWAAVVLSGVGAYAVWSSDPGGPPDPSILGDAIVGEPIRPQQPEIHGYLDMAYKYKSSGEFQTFGDEGWTGRRPVPAGNVRTYHQRGSVQAALAGAYQRLRDGGWQTGALTQSGACPCGVFWASRDGALLRVRGYAERDGQALVEVGLHRSEPGGVLAAAIAGFVVGLVLVWPMMTWLTHRFARTPRGGRILTLLFGLPVLCACVANTVDNLLSMVPDPNTASVLLAADLMYPLANQAANPLAATVIGLGLAAGVAITTLTPRHRRRLVGRVG